MNKQKLYIRSICTSLLIAAASYGAGADSTIVTAPSALSFTDITAAALPESPSAGAHCAAFADISGDGLPDLYVTMYYTADIADLFFVNSGTTVFSEQASAWDIEDIDGGSHGAVFADLDNDGDFDLINGTTVRRSGTTITGGEHNDIFRNNNDGSFTDVSSSIADLYSTEYKTRSVVAFDMDNDGDLDLFTVSGFLGSDDGGDLNEVYENNGSLSFTRLNKAACGDLYDALTGQGATDTDFDNDGDIDIICANRTGDLNIAENNGSGYFTISAPSNYGIAHGAGDGITMGDVDNDGHLDMLLVTGGAEGFAVLYTNDGDGTFTFSAQWSSQTGYMGNFGDLDNDGDLDLVFAGDSKCYLNNGSGTFSQGPAITYSSPSSTNDPRSISLADIDNDGDLDMGIGDKKEKFRIIRNDLVNENNWLKIDLASASGQAGSFGAKIELFPPGQAGSALIGFREARSSTGYIAQNDPVVHFGTGSYTQVDVKVTYLDGTTALRTFVPVNQTISIDHPDVLVDITAMLQGPFDTDTKTMHTYLASAGIIPLTSPYAQDPRTIDSVPASIVDWVLVQARSAPDGENLASVSALLRSDGRIVGDNGTTEYISLPVESGSYYIVVSHRNHLKTMSSTAVALSYTSTAVYSFSASSDNSYDTAGMTEAAPGYWVLCCGDATGDGFVNAHDKNLGWKPDNGTEGYKSGDMNLDTFINATDKNECWRPNNGKGININ